MDNLRIVNKLVVAFGIIVMVVLGMAGSLYWGLASEQAATRANGTSHAILAAANDALSALVEKQNAVRGYVATDNDSFLPRIQGFEDAFEAAAGRLSRLDPGAGMQSVVAGLKDQAADIRRQENRLVALAGRPETVAQARADLATAGRLTQVRAIVKGVTDAQAALIAVRGRAQAAAMKAAGILLVVGCTLSVLIALGVGWLLTRSIGGPVVAMTAAMGRLAGGDVTIVIPAVGRRDEVGQMADAVQAFKDGAIERRRLEVETEAMRQSQEAERRRQQEERDAAARQLAGIVDALASGLENLAGGDLVFRLQTPFGEGYEKLRTDFNRTMDRLQATMRSIAANTGNVRASAGEISQASQDLARRSEQTAAGLEQTSAALDQITAAVRSSAAAATEAREAVRAATTEAQSSGAVVRNAVDAMSAIEISAGQIGEIAGMIEEIARHTNILALNASVEAARAGEAGRGFGIVATEVRTLAQRSTEAAKKVKDLITVSGTHVQSGVRLVNDAGGALEQIASHVSRLNTLVEEITVSAQEQASGLGQVNMAVNQMDRATQQNAAMVEQSSAVSHSLASEADGLARLVGQFRTGSSAGSGLPARKAGAA
ncbi:methyl-accepting chemotaxis protein [Gluconacetobacter takamatsuzukensis]|uniref:Methyl-accepting chemotaxis protein n=1 Tax=Gluconacetobacter takamatsuzukensis TaxID=1286190 RepID=A0A7W4PPT4_9PROT|nr:methyl-accepting chemotaxis protein [Gluconacetobacter takamatsuzukensis]MBB2205780.1 methyl-accepting chemotaxis protein [Gluconacetobacter takamatsuzukensis]